MEEGNHLIQARSVYRVPAWMQRVWVEMEAN